MSQNLCTIQSAVGLNETPLFSTWKTIRQKLDDTVDEQYVVFLDVFVGLDGAGIALRSHAGKISREYASTKVGLLEAVIQDGLRDDNRSVHFIELIGEHARQPVETWNLPVSEMEKVGPDGLVEEQTRATLNEIATSGFDGEYTNSQHIVMTDKLLVHLVGRSVGLEA
ncbi:hypothetical protein F4803DRAFT_554782 [Xylaria telfairii]|nr:hypothetical protein F4803DRAFT_554782 [Xylaria telfairii]